jgi:two-component system nitrogen regulation sensor histidine kinase NtrY
VVGYPYQQSIHEVLHAIFDQALYPKEDALQQPQVNQVSYPRSGLKAPLTLAAIATPLPSGAVIVLDDLSFLIKSQREMAWREVARRVAHEIKNPLTPIKLSAQRLQRQLGSLVGREGELLRDCTNTIVKHTDELKELVNEFYQFARVPESHPSPNSLIEVIKEVSVLYEQAHSTLIQVINSDPRLPIFSFDRDQMKRVFINLYENSIAAMKETPFPRIEITLSVNESLKRVEIKFEDNGQGMSEEVQARVFEPYFSTKAEGSGLGMAIVRRMISDHNGYIKVFSQEKKGTQFVIELPL